MDKLRLTPPMAYPLGYYPQTATRYHDFCYGHRVYRHESKCSNLHGHGGRIHFTVAGKLDVVGRVLDFSEINKRLCQWLEDNWDHRLLLWEKDPLADVLVKLDSTVVLVPFNPTAENMADYLLRVVGPMRLEGTGVVLVECKVEETVKCCAVARL